jgi:hypothetical protein
MFCWNQTFQSQQSLSKWVLAEANAALSLVRCDIRTWAKIRLSPQPSSEPNFVLRQETTSFQRLSVGRHEGLSFETVYFIHQILIYTLFSSAETTMCVKHKFIVKCQCSFYRLSCNHSELAQIVTNLKQKVATSTSSEKWRCSVAPR